MVTRGGWAQTCKICGLKRTPTPDFMAYLVSGPRIVICKPDNHDFDPPGDIIGDHNQQELRETLLNLKRKLP